MMADLEMVMEVLSRRETDIGNKRENSCDPRTVKFHCNNQFVLTCDENYGQVCPKYRSW